MRGSPPHMRGKVDEYIYAYRFAGITPAYARKSETAAGHSTAGSGSPPHMQGKEMPKGLVHRAAGITPAYAGKSLRRCRSAASCRDHPRICGEKRCSCVTSPHTNGSPPHMRGKDGIVQGKSVHDRITPAYAGKRKQDCEFLTYCWDHPRICGEKGTWLYM